MTSEIFFAKTCLIVCLIALVRSQTVWVDVDTGKILGVSKGQNQQNNNYGQNFNRPQYPVNYGGNQRPVVTQNVNPLWNCRNSLTGAVIPISSEVMVSAFPEIIQQTQRANFPRNNYPNYHRRRQYDPSQYRQYEFTVNRGKRSTLNPEWVCTNSKTGDMLIIASETMADKFPGTNQQNINNQYSSPYPNNPWLNGQNTPTQQPGQNIDQNQPNWGQNNNNNNNNQNPPNWNQNQPNWGQDGQNNQNNLPNWGNNQNDNSVTRPSVTVTPKPTTEEPAIILTTKKPFPTLSPDIDWLQYIQPTTKPTITTSTTSTTKRPSLTQAIDGDGIIMPRGGFEE
ncbi:ras guanine nucleotide exchange factor B-like [Cotesia glomerata]|uniref:Uncharacterized protein n=1 Tax=Cotesia glomerata TaxID=32391 RepID=A0AAV7IWN2_COTGL|nr:ras guanine nucleotide exchange factor B-like [Cotesia glomerata]KAH0560413.1 hypothetical protein KQX54_004375 [Cotesia glomerata]